MPPGQRLDESDTPWLEQDTESDEGDFIPEYDISSSASDFNMITISNYIESGAIVLPEFQRHYTWDKRRASKFIESLLLGLPIPQIFLYEERKNRFLILDGQQRLMSIYYFIKKSFPKPNKRRELRDILIRHGSIPKEYFEDGELFQEFSLTLPKREGKVTSKFEGMSYDTLGDHKPSFDLRSIRTIVIKQNEPKTITPPLSRCTTD
ncbi:MAG: DUF262 domain-containing protein [Blastochloris sp.]|nr:DUF262 domain-containing protein [Blastochloris sp.]